MDPEIRLLFMEDVSPFDQTLRQNRLQASYACAWVRTASDVERPQNGIRPEGGMGRPGHFLLCCNNANLLNTQTRAESPPWSFE